MADAKHDAVERLSRGLEELGRKIELLEAKAEQKGAESKIEYIHRKHEMERQRDETRDRLQTLKADTNQDWEALKTSASDALDRLGKAYDDAASALKAELS